MGVRLAGEQGHPGTTVGVDYRNTCSAQNAGGFAGHGAMRQVASVAGWGRYGYYVMYCKLVLGCHFHSNFQADARYFRIDLPNSGKIVLAKALDFETKRHLEFVVHAVVRREQCPCCYMGWASTRALFSLCHCPSPLP